MLSVACDAAAMNGDRCQNRVALKAQEVFAGLRALGSLKVKTMASAAVCKNNFFWRLELAAAYTKLAVSTGGRPGTPIASKDSESKDSEDPESLESLACDLPHARSVCESSRAVKSFKLKEVSEKAQRVDSLEGTGHAKAYLSAMKGRDIMRSQRYRISMVQ